MLDGIHSFVGHGFTAEDEDVVRAFTDYLDTVKQAVPTFTWTHARMPEPRLVDEKVLALFEGKNVFIAICTRKELVVKPSKVATPLFFRDEYWAKQKEFEYKTSDWIIQEIGLAIGRGMTIILLLEEGVREPGALQGNLERIPFSRDDPSKAFGSLLGMISSLAARAPIAAVGSSEGKPEAEATASDPKDALSATAQASAASPELSQPDWTKSDYEMAMVTAIADKEKLESLDKAFRSSKHAAMPGDLTFWEAWKQFLLFIFRKGGDLDELRKLAAKATGDRAAETVALLASVFRHLKEYKQAASAYEQAASLAVNNVQRASQLSSAASAHVDAGELDAADASIDVIRKLAAADSEVVPTLLEAEARRAKSLDGDKSLYFGAMEAALEHNPTDHDLRFSLAFEYDEQGHNEMALFHYSRMGKSTRTPTDWNNLGVSLSKLNIHAASISAYRTAAKAGSTLATANLAYRLMESGFVDDAEKLLIPALEEKDHHSNVEKALARAKEIPEEAKTLEDEALKKAAEASDFYRNFGKALAAKAPALEGKWKGPRCILTVSVQGNNFTAYGEYEQELGFLGRGIAGLVSDPKPERYFQKFTGTLRGSTCIGKMTSGKVGEPLTPSLLTGNPATSFLAYVDSGGVVTEVMEPTSSSSDAKRYRLTRE